MHTCRDNLFVRGNVVQRLGPILLRPHRRLLLIGQRIRSLLICCLMTCHRSAVRRTMHRCSSSTKLGGKQSVSSCRVTSSKLPHRLRIGCKRLVLCSRAKAIEDDRQACSNTILPGMQQCNRLAKSHPSLRDAHTHCHTVENASTHRIILCTVCPVTYMPQALNGEPTLLTAIKDTHKDSSANSGKSRLQLSPCLLRSARTSHIYIPHQMLAMQVFSGAFPQNCQAEQPQLRSPSCAPARCRAPVQRLWT